MPDYNVNHAHRIAYVLPIILICAPTTALCQGVCSGKLIDIAISWHRWHWFTVHANFSIFIWYYFVNKNSIHSTLGSSVFYYARAIALSLQDLRQIIPFLRNTSHPRDVIQDTRLIIIYLASNIREKMTSKPPHRQSAC